MIFIFVLSLQMFLFALVHFVIGCAKGKLMYLWYFAIILKLQTSIDTLKHFIHIIWNDNGLEKKICKIFYNETITKIVIIYKKKYFDIGNASFFLGNIKTCFVLISEIFYILLKTLYVLFTLYPVSIFYDLFISVKKMKMYYYDNLKLQMQ